MTAHFYRSSWLLLSTSLVVSLLGCAEREEIRSYTVAKEAKPQVSPPAPPKDNGKPTDRMLAAIVPAGQQAWFFKLVGPVSAVDQCADHVNKFFDGIQLTDQGRPKWNLPADWKEEPGSAMRLATLKIPSQAGPLEMSVIGLPWRGTPAEVLSNINRWRTQMQLPEVGEDQLGDFTREVKIGSMTATIVDLRGRFAGGPAMMPPFAGGAAGAASRAATAEEAKLPPGHPPVDAALPPGHPPIDQPANSGAPDGNH